MNAKEKQIGTTMSMAKRRWSKLAYGLIYPAFIGNMIYDLIQFIHGNEQVEWHNPSYGFATCVAITFFYALDYVHLHVDLDSQVREETRTYWYIGGDIVTSFLFFLGFVFARFGFVNITLCCLTVVPIIFAKYNIELKIHPTFYKVYAVFSILLLVVYIILSCYNIESYEFFVMAFSLLLCVVYLVYNIVAYWMTKASS